MNRAQLRMFALGVLYLATGVVIEYQRRRGRVLGADDYAILDARLTHLEIERAKSNLARVEKEARRGKRK